MSGDRQACLDAGMSDYLAKPIVSDRLAEVVARHLRARAAGEWRADAVIESSTT